MARKLQSARSLTIRVLQEITDDFSEERKIGQGTYGKVYVVRLRCLFNLYVGHIYMCDKDSRIVLNNRNASFLLNACILRAPHLPCLWLPVMDQDLVAPMRSEQPEPSEANLVHIIAYMIDHIASLESSSFGFAHPPTLGTEFC
jgi:hypothetical protein